MKVCTKAPKRKTWRELAHGDVFLWKEQGMPGGGVGNMWKMRFGKGYIMLESESNATVEDMNSAHPVVLYPDACIHPGKPAE